MKSLFEALISAKAALLLILVYLLKKNCNAKIIVSNYDVPNKPNHCKFFLISYLRESLDGWPFLKIQISMYNVFLIRHCVCRPFRKTFVTVT